MKCPGQDTQYWSSSAIFEADCPKCGKTVEFFKDDTARKCHHCGERFINPSMDFGCASYCQHASQCIGELPEEVAAQFQKDMFKDKLAISVKYYFKDDFKRVQETAEIARAAEMLAKAEKCDLFVVLCAAFVGDIVAEDARELLVDLEVDGDLLENILSIEEAKNEKSKEYLVIHDARLYAKTKKMKQKEQNVDIKQVVTLCMTDSGKELLSNDLG